VDNHIVFLSTKGNRKATCIQDTVEGAFEGALIVMSLQPSKERKIIQVFSPANFLGLSSP